MKTKILRVLFPLSIVLVAAPSVIRYFLSVTSSGYSSLGETFYVISKFFWPYGLAGILASIVLWVFLRHSHPEVAPKHPILGLTGFVLGLLFNGLVLCTTVPYMLVLRGEDGRAMMGWAAAMYSIAFISLLLGGVISVSGLLVDRKRKWGIMGAVLAVTPLPLAIFLVHVLAAVYGFELAEWVDNVGQVNTKNWTTDGHWWTLIHASGKIRPGAMESGTKNPRTHENELQNPKNPAKLPEEMKKSVSISVHQWLNIHLPTSSLTEPRVRGPVDW